MSCAMSKQKIRVPQEVHRNPGLTKRFGLPAITAIFARASRWGMDARKQSDSREDAVAVFLIRVSFASHQHLTSCIFGGPGAKFLSLLLARVVGPVYRLSGSSRSPVPAPSATPAHLENTTRFLSSIRVGGAQTHSILSGDPSILKSAHSMVATLHC
jgi:hypothetical protein